MGALFAHFSDYNPFVLFFMLLATHCKVLTTIFKCRTESENVMIDSDNHRNAYKQYCQALFPTSLHGQDVVYLTDILLLLLAESKLDEDLLEFLIAVVDDELFKTVVLQEQKVK